MKDLLQSWLDARLSVPGMIICGVAASPDDPGTCRSTDERVPAEFMSQIFSLLKNSASVPGAEPSNLRWHTWIFANGKIRSAIREDGWIFAAAVRANSEAAQILDPLTEEFLALKPAPEVVTW
jgi:hypothetical protein